MDFMDQIETWNQNGEHQRIIDTIEALAEEERTPQIISLLARAYNNLAEGENVGPLRKAIDLLRSVEEALHDDPAWNFRMGYAYYYLDQEGPALHYFERTLETGPEDEETENLIRDCRQRLALPRFEKPFRERSAEAWASFLAGEAELRAMMEERTDSERLMARCGELLAPAFTDVAFQLGFSGEKYELVLSPEGSRAKLFQLASFQRLAPAEVLERWNILIGRQPSSNFRLSMSGQDIDGDDVSVWVQEPENGCVALSLYCEKLLPVLQEDEGQAYWLLSILLDQTLGELSVMELVDDFTVVETPADGVSIPLNRLAEHLEEKGFSLIPDSRLPLERYTAYEMEPEENEADLRLDVFAGMTRCPSFINEYLQGKSGLMDEFHEDGAVPGFFYYPLDGFAEGEGRGQRVLDFRESVEAAIIQEAGEEAITFTGGASGLHYGYLDFIAWDLEPVLDAAAHVFEGSPLAWAAFHTFRRDVGGVMLKGEPEEGQDGESE